MFFYSSKRTSKRKSSKRTSKRKGSNTWVRACKKLGYMRKGSGKLLPKKGSVDYKKIIAVQKTL